jgi:mRNA interferase MazF
VSTPRQREVWLAQLDPVAGHEPSGTRPVVVVSQSAFNDSGWGLCICVPLSRRDRGSPLHVTIAPPEGGLRERSHALVDQVRSVDRTRLAERWGEVGAETHARIVSLLLRILAPA